MTSHFKNVQTRQVVLGLLFPALLGLAITRQSLWMDEGFTAWFASHESFASFFSTLMGSKEAPGDPQMLFYLLYMWGWVKVWGASEIALRAANIPFAILLVGTIRWASRTLFRRADAWMLLCLSPFMWFYMNEARPYVAVMAFAAAALVAALAYLMHPADYRVLAPWFCLTALLLACGSHILGLFLVPSLVALAVVITWNQPAVRRNLLRDWSPASLSLLPVFLALGAFFLWTSRFGVNMKRAEPGIANLAFVLYEFSGFAGLGPPRNELRENPHVHILIAYWPWLLIGIAATLAVAYVLLRTSPDRIARGLVISLLTGLSIASIVSKVAHFQLLGRHAAVFFPMLFILLLAWTKDAAHSSGTRYLGAAALTALAVAWGISDLRLVLLPQYEKESYRAASSISVARADQSGGEILWAADTHTAYYYGVRVTSPYPDAGSVTADTYSRLAWPVRGQAIDAGNWTIEQATAYVDHRNAPLILVLSRPDLYDEKRGWRALVEKQRPAVVGVMNEFQIFEWPARSENGTASLNSVSQPAAPALFGAIR